MKLMEYSYRSVRLLGRIVLALGLKLWDTC